MKRLTLSILFTAISAAGVVFPAFAQENVTFEVAAPTVVEAGEAFRIEFVVNARGVEFTEPAIEGFEVLAGPLQSNGTSTSIDFMTGNSTRVDITTYSYVLQCFTAGMHTISTAHATVNGKSYSTKPITIEVVGDASRNNAAARQGQTQGATGQGSVPEISADDIFVRVVVNRSGVYKNEPVVATLKLYSRGIQVGGMNDLKLPSFNGFWQQDITSGEPVHERETYNNRVYDTWTLKEYLLYPQQSGQLTIEPFDAGAVVLVPNRNNSAFELFGDLLGDPNFLEISKRLSSQSIRIDVREWPDDKPAGFDGAVGQFELSATPPPPAMNANTSGTYTLRLSGTGNFPLIRAPKLTLPESFERYNVPTSDNTRNTRTGTSGYREFSYQFIPRTDGLYTIPAFEFSYFDPRQERYVTLSSRETSIEVAADTTATASRGGLVSGMSREELQVFGQDIQFIKRGGANLHPKGRMFMWSPLYISFMAFLVVLFAVSLAVLRRYVRNMQSDRFVRGKRANKVALKRFRVAEVSMKQDDRHGFYDEMLKALWGYMSDKLDIPMALLTKEHVREELFERSVPEVHADEYIRIISECEEAQYSPASSARMQELYKEGVSLVSELESAIKI